MQSRHIILYFGVHDILLWLYDSRQDHWKLPYQFVSTFT